MKIRGRKQREFVSLGDLKDGTPYRVIDQFTEIVFMPVGITQGSTMEKIIRPVPDGMRLVVHLSSGQLTYDPLSREVYPFEGALVEGAE